MRLFNNNYPRDVVFLEPVKLAGEELPREKMRMLYCDAKGKVYAGIIDKAVYKLAMDSIANMESSHRDYATLGLEIGSGNYLPQVVEIGSSEVWALEHVLDHARKNGSIPNILKKQLKQIIRLGQSAHREKDREKKDKNSGTTEVRTPFVLNRLPYYSEKDMEFSMPVYKSELSFPLLVLKHLEPDENSHNGEQRLLILDNEGDLAVIKMPLKIIVQSEKRLEGWAEKSDIPACIIISRKSNGFDINFLTISQAQKKALETMVKRFEETGEGQQSISASTRKVLVRARDMSVAIPG